MTNRTEQPSRGRASRVLPFAVFALIATCLPGAATAQWATNGYDISNTNAGNVGVGTQTPHAKLDARSAAPKTDPSQHVVFTAGSSEPDTPFLLSVQWFGNSMLSGRRIELQTTERNIADGGNLILQARAGNVGIGTTTPSQKLSVLGMGAFYNSTPVQPSGVRGLFMGNFSGGSSIWSYNYVAGVGDPLQVSAQDISLNTYVGGSGVTRLHINSAGNVGIGTAAPAAKLHVAGDIRVDGNINAKYQDVAEWVPSTQKLAPGTVARLDPERSNHVLASKGAYDTRVAGVISAQPGISLGEAGEGKVLVATTGRVKVRVDATRAPIRIGDLLVTSDAEGVAMKSEPVVIGGRKIHAPGTIIGKALEPLEKGTGEILVLLSLQ